MGYHVHGAVRQLKWSSRYPCSYSANLEPVRRDQLQEWSVQFNPTHGHTNGTAIDVALYELPQCLQTCGVNPLGSSTEMS